MFVEQALDALNLKDLEQANLNALPVAIVGQYFAASKGEREADPDWFNPVGRYLFRRESRALIEPDVAQTFLSLSAKGLIPSWAINQVNVKQIRAAATDD